MYRGYWKKAAVPVFDNVVLRELPIDAEVKTGVRSKVGGVCFAKVRPTPLKHPELVICAPDALKLAGIHFVAELDTTKKDDDSVVSLDALVPYLAGNELFPGSETAAQCYCGHQFGFFSGQLGDGAAIYLGEAMTQINEERWEMQIKGAGLTPFSRSADGRKVLRSTLREFLASEHMHALGIPTTRAGSVVVSHDTRVWRDAFYSGDAQLEPCAVVLRIARTFIRFGSFEIFKERDALTGRGGPSADLADKKQMMTRMLHFVIRHYYPSVWSSSSSNEQKYVAFFRQVVRKTAELVAKWQSVGFCHGVLNTDNMSIVGDTLDYGPFGFMEHYNPKHICNTSDESGRYRFEEQPKVCKWNCAVLASELALVCRKDLFDRALDEYDEIYQKEYYGLMMNKLGLKSNEESCPLRDRQLIDAFIRVLTQTGADYTCALRFLSQIRVFEIEPSVDLVQMYVSISATHAQAQSRYKIISDDRMQLMENFLRTRPEEAKLHGLTDELEAMKQQKTELDALKSQSAAQYEDNVREGWRCWLRLYMDRAKEESRGIPDAAESVARQTGMNRVNPALVLRNHVALKAIQFATDKDYGRVADIFNLLTHPFDEPKSCDLQYARPQDPKLPPICVSCSS